MRRAIALGVMSVLVSCTDAQVAMLADRIEQAADKQAQVVASSPSPAAAAVTPAAAPAKAAVAKPTATPTATPSPSPTPTATPSPTPTPEPTETPTATPTPVPSQRPFSFKGRGRTGTTDSFEIVGGQVRFAATHSGVTNFVVWLQDEKGEDVKLLFNEVGTYVGKFNAYVKPGTYRFNVRYADGDWNLDVR